MDVSARRGYFEANWWGEAVHTGVIAGSSVLKGNLLCTPGKLQLLAVECGIALACLC